MKLTSLLQKLLFVPVLLGMVVGLATSCSDKDEELQGGGNGYVQFKLYKEASYGKEKAARVAGEELEYLNDAKKIKVMLTANGITSSYTLPLSAFNEENAEYGLRSEKLELLAGAYNLVGFYLYNKVEEEIYAGEPAEPTVVMVEKGALHIQDVLVNAVPRGKVRFHLVKDLSLVEPKGRSGEVKYYPLSAIERVTMDIKNLATKKNTHIENVKVKYVEDFHEDSFKETSYAVLDSLISLEAGDYTVTLISTMDRNKVTMEVGQLNKEFSFTVADNQNADKNPVKVPLTLQESAAYIKDYIALYNIWTKMNGATEWSYVGENYPRGVNWNFDKDIDMWGVQPGVGLNTEGRVVSLSIGDFGPKGPIPAELGDLTALQSLSLGTHNDKPNSNVPNGSSDARRKFATALMNPTAENLEIIRNDYMDNFVKHDIRADLSEPLLWGLKHQGVEVGTGKRISSRDINWGEFTNGITSVPEEIGNLTELEVLYIANSKITTLPESMKNLAKCTDMELYNNSLMKEFPAVLAEMPELVQLNLAMNKQWSSQVIDAGLEKLFDGKSKEKLQILYMGFNNSKNFPSNVTNLKKLSKIDCVYNQIETLPPFTGINLVQANFDNNKIKSVPDHFCGIDDVESISFAGNQISKLPEGFFDMESIYTMSSVDFSSNNITEVPDNYGANVSTLSLARNKLTKFPKGLFKMGSPIGTLNLSGNLISKFEEGDIEGENSYMLTTLDLTYNKLSKFPKDFNAVNLPYLYGVDVSFNSFDAFPYEPLNIDRLTVLALRGQRDADGNRTLTEWPADVDQHKGLRALYLGSNDIGDVNIGKEENISYLIYNLDISDNPNIVINLAEVCPYIQAGMYVLVYDPSQDIRGCDILNLDK